MSLLGENSIVGGAQAPPITGGTQETLVVYGAQEALVVYGAQEALITDGAQEALITDGAQEALITDGAQGTPEAQEGPFPDGAQKDRERWSDPTPEEDRVGAAAGDCNAARRVARRGDIEGLRNVRPGTFWFNHALSWNAASSGSMDCIRWLADNGFGLHSETITTTVQCHRFDQMRQLHEMGWPWDKFACYMAAKTGDLECLTYLIENGCPYDWQTRAHARFANQKRCEEYLRNLGIMLANDMIHSLSSEDFNACELHVPYNYTPRECMDLSTVLADGSTISSARQTDSSQPPAANIHFLFELVVGKGKRWGQRAKVGQTNKQTGGQADKVLGCKPSRNSHVCGHGRSVGRKPQYRRNEPDGS